MRGGIIKMTNKFCPGNWLCLIDLENTQHCYAKCLQLVQWLEKIGKGEGDNQYVSDEMLPFFISRMENGNVCNKDILLQQERYIADKDSKKYSKITSKEQLISGLEKESSKYENIILENRFNYYFRIHLNHNDGDITELQYFVLLLQMMPSIRGKVAARIMELTENEWSESDFFRVSHFLRFIQTKYHCFFACYNKELSSLRFLLQDADGTQTSFLPVLEVNGQLYQTLNKTWFLEYELDEKCRYSDLYTTIYPKECAGNDLTKSLFKIGFRMLFKSLSGRKYASYEKKHNLLKFLTKLVQDIQGITPLDMLLFSTLAGDKLQSHLDFAVAKNCMGEMQMLSLAISQILENIVNHSERNQGVFTFRIQNNQEYLNKHYPGYLRNKEKDCIELLIADGNRVDGIVKHFLNSNKADIRLKNHSEDICLGQLLGDYKDGEMSEIWNAVRKEHPEMCHGLISFTNSVRRLNGAFWVRSAPEIESKNYKNLYYFNNAERNYAVDELLDTYIPGTQFSVIINRTKEVVDTILDNDDWAFDFDKLVYATTYKDLAKALIYEEKIVQIKIVAETLSLVSNSLNQYDKDAAATWWKDLFNSYIAKENGCNHMVFECDLEMLCQELIKKPKLGEPFCKGFLSSHFFIEPEKSAYYCILFKNVSACFSRVFAATLRVIEIQGIAVWERTGVYFILRQYKGGNLSYCTSIMQNLLEHYDKKEFEKIFPDIFPTPLFIKKGETTTEFEQELLQQAQTSITDMDTQGFKIKETHMRLGNKVHLDEFYEMALFFENPNYAYYTAFLCLRTLLTEYPNMLYDKPQILFYGYASYSRAIIWAILQILNQYKKHPETMEKSKNGKALPEIEFVIYQNDLKLDSEEPQIQMYYSREQWQRKPHEIWNPEDTTLVSIVPISSSLTTFNKMRKELNQETGKNFISKLNYTAFWVRNKFNANEICSSTDEEKNFWETVNPDTKIISSKFIDGEIKYLTYVTSTWRDPLGCEKCFPEDPIFEYPLVETDPTSTVPTQQFYLQKQCESFNYEIKETNREQQNNERIANLKGNMLYGHISKGENHYQYFVKNQVYFQQERNRIILWLKELRKKAENMDDSIITSSKYINVLIIPQKTDNVEFSQYVYEYYFQGCAECVIINTEKEFRSNFKAAYSGLFRRLRAEVALQKKVKFHYVDTSLQSGSSFNRAVSLLSACMEDSDLGKNTEKYEFQIAQIFLLISRLSESSKRRYVKNPEQEFHAYAQLSISAMRTFGDSCVPCKLQQEAQRYYKKAATKSISSYWEKKIYARACVPFDQVEMNENEDMTIHEEGYRRMICTHRAAYYIRPIQGAAVLDYFLALRKFFDEICNANLDKKTQSYIYRYVNNENRGEWMAAALKVIARPFFAYDYKIRCAVMDMYLLLAEYWIGESNIQNLRIRLKNGKNEQKKYLLEKGNIEWIKIFADNLIKAIGTNECDKLAFIRNNILKSLADIKSNYILRKKTLIQISHKISTACQKSGRNESAVEFYQHYLRSILRMTHSSSDETKSLWLEYLLQFGEEYKKENWSGISDKECNGISKFLEEVPKNVQQAFRNFMEVLLVENNRPIYQLVAELHKKTKLDKKQNENEERDEGHIQEEQKFLNEYITRKSAKFLQFGKQNVMDYAQLHSLHKFLILLNQTSHEIDRYNDLGKALQGIVESDTTPTGSVVLFGENGQIDDTEPSPVTKYLNLPDYFELYPQYIEEYNSQGKTEEQVRFEKEWEFIKKDKIANAFLNENGFYMLKQEGINEKVNIVIKLENNYDALVHSKKKLQVEIQKIEPIYIYIPCSICRQQALGLTRKILMFRRKLIEWLETDFNNNAIAVLSRQQYLAKVLSTDKMGDHAENDFVECQELLLLATDQSAFDIENKTGNWENAVTETGETENIYEIPEDTKPPLVEKLTIAREWFFLRSYVNSRISRLFRTMVRSENELGWGELINVEDYYARDGQSVMMCPVRNLKTVFFTPIKVGYIRKNYLRQMMDTITFTIQGIPDYQFGEQSNPDATIDERLQNVSNQFENFCCISLYSEKKHKQCAYLAEYLTVILLDCFISGIKAGEIWNQAKWGGEAFQILQRKRASEKCEIQIDRENGGLCGSIRYDFLVIQNKIYHPLRSEKKGFGMSLAAIKWYIDSLWRECICNQTEYPQVDTIKTENQYIIKLPILESEVKK